MPLKFKRRQFLQASIAATASIGYYNIATFAEGSEERVEAVVIGSGFGGAVASLRLAQAGIETVVLERGRRWPITDAGDTFSTYDKPDGRSTWLSPTTIVGEIPIDVYTGVLDIKVGDGVSALRGAGVGGGSLVYNAITYQPTEELFYTAFPRSINYEELDRVYYPRVRSILKPSPIPDDILQSPFYLTSRIVLEQAAKANLTARKVDMNVDWDIVRQEIAGTKVRSAIDGQVFQQIPFPDVPEGVYTGLTLAINKPEGFLTYNPSTKTADLVWDRNSDNNQKIKEANLDFFQRLNEANGTTLAQQPDDSTTAHPLGGATIGAVCSPYGQVRGYRNLFVVDGAFIPGSTACANPSLTIAALAERNMDRLLNRYRKRDY